MYTKDYIQATYEVLRKGTDSEITLSALKAYLSRRGLVSLYPSILRGLTERLQRSASYTTPRVVVARKNDFKKHEQEIDDFLKELTGSTEHEVHIDKHLIGGFIIENANNRIDRSFKHSLVQAYTRLLEN